MTSEELENIVSRHEMQQLELKESYGAERIETACAFTNSQGGFILIGVDNDGNPSKHQLRFEGLRDYENKISTAAEPSVAVDAEKGSCSILEHMGRGLCYQIAAVVGSFLCGLVGKIIARLEENCTWLWAMSSTGRALGVACVI